MLTAGPRRVAQRILPPALSAAFLLLLPTIGVSATCGDNIDGVRVPCACGDVVVSDTKLLPGDPVVRERCRFDGLVIAASRDRESIRLDLNGLSIVGSGYGVGLRVLAGGSDGAVIVGGTSSSRAELAGFGTGVQANHAQAVSAIKSIVVSGNRYDGLSMRTAGAILSDVRAVKNGGNGIRLRGQGGQLRDVEAAANAITGIRLDANGVIVDGVASKNGRYGIVCHGNRNDIGSVVASENGLHGLVVRGGGNRIEGFTSIDNGFRLKVRRRTRGVR